VRLAQPIWSDNQKVSIWDNGALIKPFSWDEISGVIANLKTDTALGTGGFLGVFYKICCFFLKFQIKSIFDDLFMGRGDLWRINHGVLSLIPKAKGATNINSSCL
jgi:hypothetical protein